MDDVKYYLPTRDGGVQRMLSEFGMTQALVADAADILVFVGGADVDPAWYGETNAGSFSDLNRDRYENEHWLNAKRVHKPCVGICRGGQFLNVMNGGKMWQDVNNHAIAGTHEVTMNTGYKVQATSTHHQMMREGPDAVVLGTAALATRFVNDEGVYTENPDGLVWDQPDREVIYYPKSNDLCFQPHPEYGSSSREATELFYELMEAMLK